MRPQPGADVLGQGTRDVLVVDGRIAAVGPDAAAHGNVPFLPWYLQQVRAYELAHGVRLVDYLDIHYYPQGTNIALSSDESATTAARRLRSLLVAWQDGVDAEAKRGGS